MIIDLQRQVRQVGRIRLGEVKNGRPQKLTTFRLSSVQRAPIDRAAQLYGGTVTPMRSDRSDDQWEVITDTSSIPVVIPPTSHLDQWLELWSAAGCERRCDGREAIVANGRPTAGVACLCDPDNRECRATTRLWVVLPDLEALGVWRLETHGYYAATELAGAADLCAAATQRGLAIPARLDLEARTRRTRDATNKPQTFKYAVPVLSVDVSIPQARAILGGQVDVEIRTPPPAPELAAGPDERTGQWVRAEAAAAEPSQQPAALAPLPPPAPAVIPPPRTHDEYTADQNGDTEPGLPAAPPPATGQRKLTEAQRFAIGIGMADDDQRHRLYTVVTGTVGAKFGDLTPKQRNEVARHANAIHQGETSLEQLETSTQQTLV